MVSRTCFDGNIDILGHIGLSHILDVLDGLIGSSHILDILDGLKHQYFHKK